MPVDKLEKLRSTDIDSSSITTNSSMQHVICCSECGETQFTLRGVKDKNGKRTKPAKFICINCFKK